ncbi:alanine racemase [Virgifigura deserti]|uniref:alanine racemase n=1 Tax=Virgifigura deserti TaxID=2268457 RepID=UPI003CCB7DBB
MSVFDKDSGLDTPALLLDRDRLERNLDAMRARMAALGVTLRPHLKTAKSVDVARLAVGDGGPITVSTLREAEGFAENGFRDILYAVGMTPTKLPRVARLLRQGVDLKMIVDTPEAADAVGRAASAEGVVCAVLIEIDSGGARAGVLPQDDRLLEIARRLAGNAGTSLAGVMTHAGHSYQAHGREAIEAVARDEAAAVAEAAGRLREAGFPCPIVSTGSTPTAVVARDVEGVTEMRPGVYMFFDLDQVGIGVCGIDDIALSVLASVVGHNRQVGQILIDAGGLALSKDTSAGAVMPGVGYGLLCSDDLVPLDPLVVADVHQEHGIVPVPDEGWFDRLPIGAQVRVLPNHACMTAAAYDGYHILQGGRLAGFWSRINGW